MASYIEPNFKITRIATRPAAAWQLTKGISDFQRQLEEKNSVYIEYCKSKMPVVETGGGLGATSINPVFYVYSISENADGTIEQNYAYIQDENANASQSFDYKTTARSPFHHKKYKPRRISSKSAQKRRDLKNKSKNI